MKPVLPAHPDTRLLRRVLAEHLDEYSRPTIAAFLLKVRDSGRLSVMLGAAVTPEEAVAKGSTKYTYGIASISTMDVEQVRAARAPASHMRVTPDDAVHCSVEQADVPGAQQLQVAADFALRSAAPAPWTSCLAP